MKDRVLVIGDLIIDKYTYGDISRISPEAPVPIFNMKNHEYRLGGAANTFLNLKALNQDTAFIGVLGLVGVTPEIENVVNLESVKLIKDHDRKCTIKERLVVQKHQIIRVDNEDTMDLSESVQNTLIEAIESEIENCGFLMISDYSKGTLTKEVLEFIFNRASQLNIPSLVDPKAYSFEKYRGATYIKPNLSELFKATEKYYTKNEKVQERDRCSQLIKEYGFQGIFTSLSENGILFCSMSNEYHSILENKDEVIDVSGAGDTVCAVLSHALLNGMNETDACDLANRYAGSVVKRFGTVPLIKNTNG